MSNWRPVRLLSLAISAVVAMPGIRLPSCMCMCALPIQDIGGVFERPAYHESIYLVRQTRHWKPLANGYAGIEPAAYVDLRDRARRFPSEDCLGAFRERGVRYVIVHQDGYGPNKWARIQRELPAAAGGLREVARFGGDLVFELQ